MVRSYPKEKHQSIILCRVQTYARASSSSSSSVLCQKHNTGEKVCLHIPCNKNQALPEIIPFRLFLGAPSLKGLDDAVPVSIASPGQDGSWEFKDKNIPVTDEKLKEVFELRTGGYGGRCTVPTLWDSRKKEVVCNVSYDIIEFSNSGLNEFAGNPNLDLSPQDLKGQIEDWNQIVYPKVNNRVYRCGFAQSQEAYDRAIPGVAATCDLPAIMDGYYKTLFPLNASGIQPATSSGDPDSLLKPHNRDLVGKSVEANLAV